MPQLLEYRPAVPLRVSSGRKSVGTIKGDLTGLVTFRHHQHIPVLFEKKRIGKMKGLRQGNSLAPPFHIRSKLMALNEAVLRPIIISLDEYMKRVTLLYPEGISEIPPGSGIRQPGDAARAVRQCLGIKECLRRRRNNADFPEIAAGSNTHRSHLRRHG